MADLNITDTSFGRSQSGLQSLLSSYNSWIKSYQAYITGDEYKKLISAIQSGWSGADADAFVKKLNEITNSLNNRVRVYANIANTTLTTDRTNFERNQNVYSNSINNMNTRF